MARKRRPPPDEFWSPALRDSEIIDQRLCDLVQALEEQAGTIRTVERLRELADRLARGVTL